MSRPIRSCAAATRSCTTTCRSRSHRPPSAQARHRRSPARRDQLITGEQTGADEGITAAGTWLELSVSADQEAVELVSEILSRVCPGGVAVEIPFELVDEGLGTRLDPG